MFDYHILKLQKMLENILQGSNNYSRTTITPNNRIKARVAAVVVERDAIDSLNLGVDYKDMWSILRIPLLRVSCIERDK
jgi:hypothetical protein